MAWLIFADGSKKEVDYNKAATIYQLLLGNTKLDKKDEDFKKKEAFLMQVKEVQFDGQKATGPRPWEKKKNSKT